MERGLRFIQVGRARASITLFVVFFVGFFTGILPPFGLTCLGFPSSQSILTVLGPVNWPVDCWMVGQGLRGLSKNPEVEVRFQPTYFPHFVQVQDMLGLHVCSNNPAGSTHNCPLRTPCTTEACGLPFYVS